MPVVLPQKGTDFTRFNPTFPKPGATFPDFLAFSHLPAPVRVYR